MLQGIQNPLVRHAKAGDVFHYRWAARRCLKLLPPRSQLKLITVEASKEPRARGEYVIDLAEYFEDEAGGKRTVYYQLKHSIVRRTKPFAFSEVRKTLAGFALRYIDATTRGKKCEVATFCFVSNRPIGQNIKQAIEAIANGNHVHPALLEKIKRGTGLPTQDLQSFCRALSFRDSEGDYTVQRRSLHGELTDLIAGFVINDEVDKLRGEIEERIRLLDAFLKSCGWLKEKYERKLRNIGND